MKELLTTNLGSSSAKCEVRQAGVEDSAILSRLIEINIPHLLGLAEPDIADMDEATMWWIGEAAGAVVGALHSQVSEDGVEIKLMLDPKTSLELSKAFLCGTLRQLLLPNNLRLVAKQTGHALMTLRVLRAYGAKEIRSMIHLALAI